MWHHTNLLFLILCFFTEDICCDDSEEDKNDIADKHVGHGGPPIPGRDSRHELAPIPGMDPNNERTSMPEMDANNERPPIPDSLGGGNRHKNDGHRVGIIMILVITVAGVAVVLVVVTCGICILKKRHKKIETRNYQDKGTMEKHQLYFPTISPENPPPYTTKMEEEQIKSAPVELLGFSTGWYAPTMVSMPPPYTKVVDKSFHPDSTAAPGY
ncbi:hypothetical protein CHS0354_027750 [Potamilus streckersoni]|uniref:Uncharacterized protein n=1 Tax=Potamilus streckersoni TaxID=2493646 RepID=A0AAE0T2R7_9BIVA|nr:hypothetical protein CHS0354_027750 [Potamilus streckersoni]